MQPSCRDQRGRLGRRCQALRHRAELHLYALRQKGREAFGCGPGQIEFLNLRRAEPDKQHDTSPGGPADRTCNQTVMSGRINVGLVDSSAFPCWFDHVRCVLVWTFLVRNWCGSALCIAWDQRWPHDRYGACLAPSSSIILTIRCASLLVRLASPSSKLNQIAPNTKSTIISGSVVRGRSPDSMA